MYHYTYKIINLINNKLYYGVRSCECLPEEDIKYMGSGVLIRRSIKKHGIDNFIKKIDKIFETREEANLYEAKIVDLEFIKLDNTYNLKTGGLNGCGWKGWTGQGSQSDETKKKISIAMRGKIVSDETKKKMSISGKVRAITKPITKKTREKLCECKKGEKHPFYGKKHSKETIQKLSSNWMVISPTGQEYKISNLTKFCRDNNLHNGTMCSVAKGNRKHHKGLKCYEIK